MKRLNRPLAILLTIVIVCGGPVFITLLLGSVLSRDTTSIVGVLVGCVFGTLAMEVYATLRGDSSESSRVD